MVNLLYTGRDYVILLCLKSCKLLYIEVYPVRSELWTAGDVYVGKYATPPMLDDIYYNMLRGWLSYLKTGRAQYAGDLWDFDYDERDLIQKIEMYY